MSLNATVADRTTGRVEIGDRLPWLHIDAAWHAQADLFYAHHRACDQCKTAGQEVSSVGYGRCERGKSLARAYGRALREASSVTVR